METNVTMSIVITPPNTTDGTVPSNFAATPDSNAPISLDEPINILLTAETLPFILSGVISWIIVLLTTTLTLSNAPLRASTNKDR